MEAVGFSALNLARKTPALILACRTGKHDRIDKYFGMSALLCMLTFLLRMLTKVVLAVTWSPVVDLLLITISKIWSGLHSMQLCLTEKHNKFSGLFQRAAQIHLFPLCSFLKEPLKSICFRSSLFFFFNKRRVNSKLLAILRPMKRHFGAKKGKIWT